MSNQIDTTLDLFKKSIQEEVKLVAEIETIEALIKRTKQKMKTLENRQMLQKLAGKPVDAVDDNLDTYIKALPGLEKKKEAKEAEREECRQRTQQYVIQYYIESGLETYTQLEDEISKLEDQLKRLLVDYDHKREAVYYQNLRNCLPPGDYTPLKSYWLGQTAIGHYSKNPASKVLAEELQHRAWSLLLYIEEVTKVLKEQRDEA